MSFINACQHIFQYIYTNHNANYTDKKLWKLYFIYLNIFVKLKLQFSTFKIY